MKLFKNYKKLYENELENRKMYEQRYKEKEKEYIDWQKSSGLADLRKENGKLLKDIFNYQKEIQCYKEKVGKLTLDVEDLTGFLNQEKEAKEVLKRERTKLKREITMLKKELNKDGK